MTEPQAILAVGLSAAAVAGAAWLVASNRRRMAALAWRETDGLLAALIFLFAGLVVLAAAEASGRGELATAGAVASTLGFAGMLAAGYLVWSRTSGAAKPKPPAGEASPVAAHFEAILKAADAAGVGIVLLESQGGKGERIAYANEYATHMLGTKPQELVGTELTSLMGVEDREAFAALRERMLKEPGSNLSAGLTIQPAGADRVPVEIGLSLAQGGDACVIVATVLDARAKRTAQAAAREARTDADFYLDLVTHDLSNLNQGALGYLELIELTKDAAPEKLRRFQQNALVQIQNCSRLIENVKLLSIIRQSREPLEPVDAMYALHDAIDEIVFSTKGKEVEVRLVPTTSAHQVRADGRLKELFLHLLDNAVKFTPGPRVEVAVSVAEGAGGRSLVFRVADRGRGIAPSEREAILDRISSRKRDYQAYRSGIGLFIVKTLAERYGAKLWIEDRVPGEHHQGSVFCLEIPTP